MYERALQRIDVMDRSGYDAVWLAEHHFSGYSVCPSVHLMGLSPPDRSEAPADPVQRYIDEVVLHGTPDQFVDRLQQLEEEMYLDYLLCAPLSHSSFVLFTEKVLPRLV